MRFSRLALIAATCSAGACLSFGDLTGGGDDTTVPSDASSDATGDSTLPGDSSVDGAPLGDGASTPFCAGQTDATFCADFDEEPDAQAGFTSLYINDGGVLARDTTISTSPPASLQSGNLPLSTGVTAHGAVVRSTGVTASTVIQLSFDLEVDSLATQGSQVEALALVNKSSTRSSLQLNLKNASSDVGEEILELDGGTLFYPHTFSSTVPSGKWVHVIITMSFASLRSITVTVDGSLVVDHAPMSAAFVAGPLDLYLGNSYSPGPSDGSSIHYDNVVLLVE